MRYIRLDITSATASACPEKRDGDTVTKQPHRAETPVNRRQGRRTHLRRRPGNPGKTGGAAGRGL